MTDFGHADDVRNFVRQVLGYPLDRKRSYIPEAAFDETFGEFERRFRQPVLPDPKETVAVTLSSPKTAALFFDRVWDCELFKNRVPEGIRVNGATDAELIVQAMFCFYDEDRLERIRTAIGQTVFAGAGGGVERFCRGVSEALEQDRGLRVTALYKSSASREAQYRPGNGGAFLTALQNLPIVREDQLSWEQVIEFRKDSQARQRARRLLHWLDKDLVGRDPVFIENAIQFRLDEYKKALNDFGVKWALGTLEKLYDERFLALLLGVAYTAGHFRSVPLAEVLTSGLAVGGVLVKGVQQLVDLKETRAKYADIAIVAEIAEKFDKATGEPIGATSERDEET